MKLNTMKDQDSSVMQGPKYNPGRTGQYSSEAVYAPGPRVSLLTIEFDGQWPRQINFPKTPINTLECRIHAIGRDCGENREEIVNDRETCKEKEEIQDAIGNQIR